MYSTFQNLWLLLLNNWPYDERWLFVVTCWFVLNSTFWTFHGILYFIYHNNYFEKYKIQGQKWPEPQLVKDCVKKLLVNHIISRPIILYFLYPIFKKYGMKTDVDSIPSLADGLLQILLFTVICDGLFYWSHRLLHNGYIYKYVHKKHHLFKVSVGIASEYAHPIEEAFSNGFPTVAGPMFLGSHLSITLIWFWFRLLETGDAHSGYAFPWSPFNMFPAIQGGPDRHDFHHSHNVGNYGAFFTFWDRLMGTDKAYREFKKNEVEQNKKKRTE